MDRKIVNRFARVLLIGGLLALLIGASACTRATPTPAPATPLPAAGPTPIARPAVQAVKLVEPETGGAVALADGAEARFPPQALSTKAAVTLRSATNAPAVPVPYSLLGQAYELTVEGGVLTGVALLRLPLSVQVSGSQYDLAPYRWNGSRWTRLNGRQSDGAIQFGASTPGLYALLGKWDLADATLALIRPASEPGQTTVSLMATGAYRYSALPALQGDYVVAKIVLKQDISGGAGRITGDESLDKTIDEVPLWFKPAPNQASGVVEFSQAFEVKPETLAMLPGASASFYAVLTVSDAVAPTRRLSNSLEYTFRLPIQVQGMAIVRPRLAIEDQVNLRWHVRLNDVTLLQQSAADLTLPLDPILAAGGLGNYRFTLEIEANGAWLPVSNNIEIQLAAQPAPTASPTAAGAPGTQVTPAGAETPSGEPGDVPAAPTRRPTPVNREPAGTPTPTLTPLPPTLTPTPTRPAWARDFWADRYILRSGECVYLHWQIQNAISVFLDGAPTIGQASQQVCPLRTTTYTLRVTTSSGTQERSIGITVAPENQAAIEFSADDYQIVSGGCTTLRWRVTNVKAVYLNNQGVMGVDTLPICPKTNTEYELRVVNLNDTTTSRKLLVAVSTTPANLFRFWAEQYTLPANTCTTLHWQVQDVQSVFLGERGVTGQGTDLACVASTSQTYTLRIIDNSGQTLLKKLTLETGDPGLAVQEIIAQGVVSEVQRQEDVDSSVDGSQPGYLVVVDGLRPLFLPTTSWSQAVVTLRVLQSWIDVGDGGPVYWPLNPGQLVEFRAWCNGADCPLWQTSRAYLRLRSD